jgi:hypothetical protein
MGKAVSDRIEQGARAYYEMSCKLAGIEGALSWDHIPAQFRSQRIAALRAALAAMEAEETFQTLGSAIKTVSDSITKSFLETF